MFFSIKLDIALLQFFSIQFIVFNFNSILIGHCPTYPIERTSFFFQPQDSWDEPPRFTMVPRLSIPKGLPGIATSLSRLLEPLEPGVSGRCFRAFFNAKHQLILLFFFNKGSPWITNVGVMKVL